MSCIHVECLRKLSKFHYTSELFFISVPDENYPKIERTSRNAHLLTSAKDLARKYSILEKSWRREYEKTEGTRRRGGKIDNTCAEGEEGGRSTGDDSELTDDHKGTRWIDTTGRTGRT